MASQLEVQILHSTADQVSESLHRNGFGIVRTDAPITKEDDRAIRRSLPERLRNVPSDDILKSKTVHARDGTEVDVIDFRVVERLDMPIYKDPIVRVSKDAPRAVLVSLRKALARVTSVNCAVALEDALNGRANLLDIKDQVADHVRLMNTVDAQLFGSNVEARVDEYFPLLYREIITSCAKAFNVVDARVFEGIEAQRAPAPEPASAVEPQTQTIWRAVH